MTAIIALDLGTTRIKGGCFAADGELLHMASRDAPALSGDDERQESSPEAYLAEATALRDALLHGSRPAVLGLASQRSTFTVWDTRSGQARLPLISWRDRRAAGWCVRHRVDDRRVRRLTGLRLSAHYAGPKLASIIEADPVIRHGLADGTLKFGTVDSWVLWRWSNGAVLETDHTMAARTLMADARDRQWLPALLALFGVPAAGLPSIQTTSGRAIRLDGETVVEASVADQSAAALAGLGRKEGAALVNLGTGGFVICPTGGAMRMVPGYLSGPLVTTRVGSRFVLEGTINGAAGAVDRFAPAPTLELPSFDPTPEAFALPDDAGIGSPYWRADRALMLSAAAERLNGREQRFTVAEGIVFRVRQILHDLGRQEPFRAIRLSGGLSRDPFFAAALAACLDRPIDVLEDGNQTLRGAAWLAGGGSADPVSGPIRRVQPSPAHAWLRVKYVRWKRWLGDVLR